MALLTTGAGKHGATAAAPGTHLLDTLSATAVMAASTRKLRTAYSGSALRIRKAGGGGGEQDIGFSGDHLDTTSLASFIGSESGFLTKYYDQSVGGTGHFEQTTDSNQPIVVTAGTNSTINSRVTAAYGTAGASGLNYLRPTISVSQPLTIAVCVKHNTEKHFIDGDGGNRILIGMGAGYAFYAGGTVGDGGTKTANLTTFIGILDTGSNDSLYVNGTQVIGPIEAGSNTIGSGQPYFGRSGEDYMDGYMVEILVFNSALGSTDRGLIRTSWQSYWGAT